MGAPKRNNYGKEFWWEKSVAKKGEKSVKIGTRISESELEKIKQQLEPGETIHTWVRKIVRREITEEQKEAS